MDSVGDPLRAVKQDMPPAGGYGPIAYKRNVPARGPSGVAMLAGVAAAMAVGFALVARSNQRKRCVVTLDASAAIVLTKLLFAQPSGGREGACPHCARPLPASRRGQKVCCLPACLCLY